MPFTTLTIPRDPAARFISYTVGANNTLKGIASRPRVDPWWILRDNYLWDGQLHEGSVVRIRQMPPPPPRTPAPPPARYHQVRRGGQRLRIP